MHKLLAAAALCGMAALSGVTAAPANATPANQHYVDCSAKQNGDGTSTSPWNSVSSISHHKAFFPGDQIFLKRGTTCSGRITPRGFGLPNQPVLLGAYGKGAKPVVNGNGTPNLTGTVQLSNQPYWTIRDLHITNTDKKRSTTKYRSGVLMTSWGTRVAGVTITNLTVDHVNSNMATKKNSPNPREWGGISVITNGDHKEGFDGLTLSKNVISGVGRTGLIVANNRFPAAFDTNVRVTGNRITNTRGDGMIIVGSKGAIVDRNTIAHAANEWPCPECGRVSPATANAGLWTIKSRDVRIEYNEVYGTKVLGGDGEGIDVDRSAERTTVQYNYVHDNQGGGVLLCGSTNAAIRFNILEDNKKSAIAFIGTYPAKNTAVYNNTIFSSASSKARPVRYFNGARGSGITFQNNLVYNFGYSTWLWPTKPRTAANTLVGLHGQGRPTDGKTSYRNPGLKNPGSGKNGLWTLKGYKPKHPSSFQRGVGIPKTVTRDFFGKKINPKSPPRGAAG